MLECLKLQPKQKRNAEAIENAQNPAAQRSLHLWRRHHTNTTATITLQCHLEVEDGRVRKMIQVLRNCGEEKLPRIYLDHNHHDRHRCLCLLHRPGVSDLFQRM